MVWFPKTEPQPIADTPQVRAVHCLAQSRRWRHHPDCSCRPYRTFTGDYCNPNDASWQAALNAVLDEIPRKTS